MSTAYSSAKQQYIGNGVTTEWGFDFPIKKHSELKVYLKRSGLQQVLLEEGVDYSFVTENTIAFPIKTGEAKLQATDVLALQRESVFESEYNFSNQQRLEPEEVMHADDNLERQIQELKRDVTQAIRIQPTSNIDTDEYFVAVESIYENLDNITNVSGISAEIVTCSNNIEAIQDAPNQANAAAQSASDAAQSASDAAQSATNAANSAIDSANSATASATSAQAAQDALNDVHGLIATPIGTIFQSIYVDESLDIARQLNGQLISSTKFTGFRSWLNTVQTATPNLFTTEVNWQAEKTNSKLGQCGKFVVDDTAGTIRLPCVVNAQGLVDLALIGGIKSESLPNFQANLGDVFPYNETSGAVTSTKKTVGWTIYPGSNYVNGDTTVNPSVTSSTYQDNAPVQQEAIQYPYYIQVATGFEETLPAIREYNINTPFFFGQSMYSDVAPDNASWLASNGQWNAKTVYPDYYDWLVEQMNAGIKGFKGNIGYAWKSQTADIRFWTAIRNPSVGYAVYGGPGISFAGTVTAINPDGTLNFYEDSTGITYENLVYTESENINIKGTAFGNLKFASDYDFVINTADQTFRLPLLNGEEDWVGNETSVLSTADIVKDSPFQWTATKNGFVTFTCYANKQQVVIARINNQKINHTGAGVPATVTPRPGFWLKVKKGDIVSLAAENETLQHVEVSFIPAVGNGNLYYYVGDTVQDASLINAGAVLGQLSDKISRTAASDKELVVGWGMPDYSAGVSKALNTSITATRNCFVVVFSSNSTNTAGLYVNNAKIGVGGNLYSSSYVYLTAYVAKGQTYKTENITTYESYVGSVTEYPLIGG